MPERRGPVIFLDANVVFSAAYTPEGRSAALFALARRRLCRLVSSRYAMEEARRNLVRKKPLALDRFDMLTHWLHLCAEADALRLEKARSVGVTDPMDVPVLAAAIGRADILATGDRKHFGPWMTKEIQGLTILGLADVLRRIVGGRT
ncbi:MAG: PIN domain-containing protein [Elusimicrobia bacterium]|nr:PIN domain-containing protein [Elusimicrobiota bacterium]MBP9127831.1 PIN domain-containing protein [Elusimicrobiota bacterium]